MALKKNNQETPTGIMLVNLGSPDSPDTKAVRRYLHEFLSDPRVIDLPPLGRNLLLYGVVLPFRPAKSAEAYRAVWSETTGSPLIHHTEQLAKKMQDAVDQRSPGKYRVKPAMRYGSPSLESVLNEFTAEGIQTIKVIPLYPQHSAAANSSSIAKLYELAAKKWDPPLFEVTGPIFQHPAYLKALTNLMKRSLKPIGKGLDYYLFSFHGLPERQIRKSDCHNHCLTSESCCDTPGPSLPTCYRAQCYETARELAQRLKLPKDSWSVSFQSRLGRDPWIKPYTDELFLSLPSKGIKNLAVVSPSFTADCLETLEELDIRGRKDFLDAGGESFHYLPCLNSDDVFVDALIEIMI